LDEAPKGVILGLYPNPSAELIKLQTYQIPLETFYAVAADGTMIPVKHATSSWDNGTNITSIDIRSLMPGSYFLVFGKDDEIHKIPFIKQ
jgi:hypothetical protein